ncbi:MAG: hypothetical protein U0842_22000 [Candidatus Binatia bacterium]
MSEENDVHEEESPEAPAAERIAAAAHALATLRERPCLALVGIDVERGLVRPLRHTLKDVTGDALDVLLASHGGQIDAAYLIAREIRRRVAHVTVWVPLCAKSAATLICLAADELVVGDLGELGPLDPQRNEHRVEDVSMPTSALTSARTLSELNDCALQLFGEALDRLSCADRMRPYDAAERAARFVGRALAPLYARVDLVRLAEQSHGVQLSGDYIARVLRRFRPTLDAELVQRVAHRLVTGYASHGFVLDREELSEIGLPHRAPHAAEAPILDEIADALLACCEDVRFCDLVQPSLPSQALVSAA